MITNDGWVKLFRKTRQWEWYKVEHMFHLFCHLLMGANPKDGYFQGQPVKRGQIITGFHSLSADTGISIRAIRTCFERLKKSGEISVKTTNRFSVVTICKYEEYNAKPKKIDTPSVPEPTSQTTTKNNTNTIHSISKEEKEEGDACASGSPPRKKKLSDEEKAAQLQAKEKEFEVRQKDWAKNELAAYVDQYGRDMINAFWYYWSEKTRTGFKMRWETQPTWETKKRLVTWSKKEWNKPAANNTVGTDMDPKLEKLLREAL